MNLVDRAQAILLSPKTEWQVIEGETGDPTHLFTNYVAILAAVPAAAAFIGYSFGGMAVGTALFLAIFLYVFCCAGWYVEALVIDALAPTFGAQKNFPAALKLSAYSSTAAWLAGIFQIVPLLAILGIVGLLYSIYLLWLGLQMLMRTPPDRATAYAATVVGIMIAIVTVVAILSAIIF
jgi:Yip1-like protein